MNKPPQDKIPFNHEFMDTDGTIIKHIAPYHLYLYSYGHGLHKVHRLHRVSPRARARTRAQLIYDRDPIQNKDCSDKHRFRNIIGIFGVAWETQPGCRAKDVELINPKELATGLQLPTTYINIGREIDGIVTRSWEPRDILLKDQQQICYEAAITAENRLRAAVAKADQK